MRGRFGRMRGPGMGGFGMRGPGMMPPPPPPPHFMHHHHHHPPVWFGRPHGGCLGGCLGCALWLVVPAISVLALLIWALIY